MKSLKVRLTIIVVALLAVVLLTAGNVVSSQNDSYVLVGEGYNVVVSKDLFDNFGEGDFVDLDLDRFVEQNNLKKIYDDDFAAQAEAGLFIEPRSDSTEEPSGPITPGEYGVCTSRPA